MKKNELKFSIYGFVFRKKSKSIEKKKKRPNNTAICLCQIIDFFLNFSCLYDIIFFHTKKTSMINTSEKEIYQTSCLLLPDDGHKEHLQNEYLLVHLCLCCFCCYCCPIFIEVATTGKQVTNIQ